MASDCCTACCACHSLVIQKTLAAKQGDSDPALPQPTINRSGDDRGSTAAWHLRQLDIASSDPALPPFVLTDFFELEGELHIDVAFITNEATIEYVRDVNRVSS